MKLVRRGALSVWIARSAGTSAALSPVSSIVAKRSISTRAPFVSVTEGFSRFNAQRRFFPTSDKLFTTRNIASSSFLLAEMTEKAAEHTSFVKIAMCQFPVTEEKMKNHETAVSYIQRAVTQHDPEIVVLPEIWNSPYATAAFPEYAEPLPEVASGHASVDAKDAPSAELLQKAAIENKVWLVGGSIPERAEDGKIYNTCLVYDPSGKLVAKHRKVHLFDIDVPGGIRFCESETLSAGNTFSHFTTPWGNVGVGICYDIRFPDYAMALTRNYQCKILIYPGAFNLTTGPAHWELLQRSRALDNQCYVVTASPARVDKNDGGETGKYPHYTAWGHSSAVSPWGDVVATTDEKEGIVLATLDMSKVEQTRTSIPILQQRRTDLY